MNFVMEARTFDRTSREGHPTASLIWAARKPEGPGAVPEGKELMARSTYYLRGKDDRAGHGLRRKDRRRRGRMLGLELGQSVTILGHPLRS